MTIQVTLLADSNVKKSNFDLRNKVSQRITRNGSDVHIDYRRTAVGQKAVSVFGAKLWNSIPMNIRNSNTIITFKSHMYQFRVVDFVDHYFRVDNYGTRWVTILL